MYWMNLITSESGIIPSPDTVSVNPCYSEVENYVYYEKAGLFRSRLDGSDRSAVDNQGGSVYPYSMFAVSKDHRYISHKSNTTYNDYQIRIFDKTSQSGINLPVKINSPLELLGVMCRDVNRVFYISPGNQEELWVRDLDTGEGKKLTATGIEVVEFYMLAPTWDGSKVYFYANIVAK
jgi:hypothetical protein